MSWGWVHRDAESSSSVASVQNRLPRAHSSTLTFSAGADCLPALYARPGYGFAARKSMCLSAGEDGFKMIQREDSMKFYEFDQHHLQDC